MPPNEPTYTISGVTKAKVKDLFNHRDYPAAYQAVADDLKAQAAHGAAIDTNTLTWYSDAAQINDPHANSFIHDFVRAYVSDYAQLTQHGPIDDAQFQKVSDDLAHQVLKTIGDTGNVPDFNVVGKKDTTNAVRDFAGFGVPVDEYAWPAYADLASFPSLRNFKNATWLNSLTPVEQQNILEAAAEAGAAAAWKSRGKGITGDDVLNAPSLVGKLGFVEGEIGLQHAMKFAMAFYGSVKRAAAALEGKSVLERLRHYAAQARADAARKPLTPAMQLHRNLMNLIQHQRSYAPVPNGGGGPARPAAGDKGAWAAPQPAAGHPAAVSPRMDATLQKLSPAQAQASNAHGAGAAPAAAASGGPFQLAEMMQIIGAEPPGLPPGFFKAIANSPAAMASRFAAIGLASSHLPSIAPRMAPPGRPAAAQGGMTDEGAAARGAANGVTGPRFAARATGGEVDTGATAATNPAASAEHRKALKLALQEYFDQQSRLPPNGATGFDPRLTPAWPALQLPA